MVLTAGILSLISAGSNSAKLSTTAASGGTAPYTQQWYRDTSGAGFTPGSGNILLNSTALTLDNAGLVPNTTYYYKVVYTDATTSTVESAAFVVTTLPASQGMNQFAMAAILGSLDLQSGPKNVVAAQVDASQLTPLYPGQPIKFVNNSYGIPTVVSDGADMPNGYIVYDQKSPSFPAGSRCELARTQSCIWLYSTAAIARGKLVVLDPDVASGVKEATGNTDLPIIGEAFDQSIAGGQLLRIILNVPSNMFDNATGSQDFLMPTQQIFNSGSGLYTPTSSPRPALYKRVQIFGGGGGGYGSVQGNVFPDNAEDGGDSTFDSGNLVAGGGKGASFNPGSGGIPTVLITAPGFSFNGQDGALAAGSQYDTGFLVAPYRVIQDYIPGGIGGNNLFSGGGMSDIQKNAIANSGCGGCGGRINVNTENGTFINAGSGGGAGAWLDYILPPTPATYSVGIGGAGGPAGANGHAGGNGAAGKIIVTEYYQ